MAKAKAPAQKFRAALPVNNSMPYFPKGTKLRHRIMCLLGYHYWGAVFTHPDLHPAGFQRLRDQCSRCGTLRVE